MEATFGDNIQRQLHLTRNHILTKNIRYLEDSGVDSELDTSGMKKLGDHGLNFSINERGYGGEPPRKRKPSSMIISGCGDSKETATGSNTLSDSSSMLYTNSDYDIRMQCNDMMLKSDSLTGFHRGSDKPEIVLKNVYQETLDYLEIKETDRLELADMMTQGLNYSIDKLAAVCKLHKELKLSIALLEEIINQPY